MFSAHQLTVLPLSLWIFIGVVIVPRFIHNPRTLGITVMVVGAVLAWVASLDSPFPWTISVNTLFAIFATGGALAHSEIIFRRKNGYWRFVGPRSA